ncbi:GCN5-related N-acetyltransferase [Fischerella sp. NIES-4106]|jgi:ribosomal protein S18 acetylase RimI-like enzyme|nr:GCN5-related N-acetyltransferase [Fischerella sp. NIES-4106]
MWVLPEYRGFGFANDLLFKGTRVLQNIGVWRVFCDTDVNNLPMISALKRVGYRQYSQPWERPL